MPMMLSLLLYSVVFFLCLFASNAVGAAELKAREVAKIDGKIFYNGKILSPLCFEKLISFEQEDSSVDLRSCESPDLYADVQTKVQGNYIESSFKYRQHDNRDGLVSYKFIGKVATGLVVLATKEKLSNVDVIKILDNNLIKVDEFYGGDRCNYGIDNVKILDGKIHIIQDITQSDFRSLSEKESKNRDRVWPFLLSTPVDCYAKALYIDKKYSGVILDPDLIERKKIYSEQGSDDSFNECFNKLYLEQSNKKKYLTVRQFDRFVNNIYSNCVKK